MGGEECVGLRGSSALFGAGCDGRILMIMCSGWEGFNYCFCW